MIYFIAWIFFSVVLLGFTLIRPHPYRFTRFLAFESILSLIFLNASTWFREPLSVLQILSWISLTGSLLLVSVGFYQIKTQGDPEGDFEDTTILIKAGVYKYIRHPLYASLLFFSLGAFLKDPSLLGGVLVVTTGAGVFLTARIEERFNLERFGDEYGDYMEKTRKFIPFIY